MRKLFVVAGTVIFLGMSNSAYSYSSDWWRNLQTSEWSLDLTIPEDLSIIPTPAPPKPAPPKEYLEIIELLKKQLNLKQQQLSQTEKVYQSITRSQKTETKDVDYTSFFFKDPELIYDEKTRSKESYKKILEEEEKSFTVFDRIGKNIFARLQYVSGVHKAVILQAFQETENRLNYLVKLVSEIEKTKDLKDIADFQARINGILAMIQNESIKLQMIAHLTAAEHKLVKAQKRKVDLSVFSSYKKEMPSVRF